MIPIFPEFKKLELSDKEDVEKFTLKYPPYSDFNFAGAYSWDVRDKVQISQLNGNYVMRYVDYLTGEPFYTFLGENDVNDTAKRLLDLSVKEGLKPELKLISEEMVRHFDTTLFKIEESRDHFDYIYEIDKLKHYDGKLKKKEKQLNSFLKENPTAEAKVINLKDENAKKEITRVFHAWIEGKTQKNTIDIPHEEIIVIEKLFNASNTFDLVGVGVFINSKLSAFCLNELIKKSDYVIAHVLKADLSINGIYSFLMKKNAEVLSSFDKKYFNNEQDLGLENIREAKIQFRPSFFGKKYSLTYLDDKML